MFLRRTPSPSLQVSVVRSCVSLAIFIVGGLATSAAPLAAQTSLAPGSRTVNDAHNCYPYDGRWNDRIDRALASGVPVAIEQDVNWYVPSDGSAGRVLVSHGGKLTGAEPEFEIYFLHKIQPVIEAALRSPDHSQWPVVTLNLDFKTEEPAELRAVWAILERYQKWLTTATRLADGKVAPLQVGPLLVLNGPSDKQQKIFYDVVPVGAKLLTFGAVHTNMQDVTAAPQVIESEPVSNYRRWWNNPWSVVEPLGQSKTGEWSAESDARLKALVTHAHHQRLWIRFYTLDGATDAERRENGWYKQYGFANLDAARQRWTAAIETKVDYLASDQYEKVGKLINAQHSAAESAALLPQRGK
jgi:hypothetical protein